LHHLDRLSLLEISFFSRRLLGPSPIPLRVPDQIRSGIFFKPLFFGVAPPPPHVRSNPASPPPPPSTPCTTHRKVPFILSSLLSPLLYSHPPPRPSQLRNCCFCLPVGTVTLFHFFSHTSPNPGNTPQLTAFFGPPFHTPTFSSYVLFFALSGAQLYPSFVNFLIGLRLNCGYSFLPPPM